MERLPYSAWYLDPVVAEHKRQSHLALLRRWMGAAEAGRVLKTDLFEESHQIDQILFDPLLSNHHLFGFDLNFSTVRNARDNDPSAQASFWTGDVRQLPLPSECIDWILSTSTLDHFEKEADFHQAIAELVRVLCPGGVLILTLDNVHNPLYWGLRLASRLGYTPYPLGFTASLAQLQRTLSGTGLEVLETDLLIHNPRGLSTLLFIMLRWIAGKRADGVLQWLLNCFDRLNSFPTRKWTACFIAICARKPAATNQAAPPA